jgi:hypothetical protein
MGNAARQIAGEGGSRILARGSAGRASRLMVCHDFIVPFWVRGHQGQRSSPFAGLDRLLGGGFELNPDRVQQVTPFA